MALNRAGLRLQFHVLAVPVPKPGQDLSDTTITASAQRGVVLPAACPTERQARYSVLNPGGQPTQFNFHKAPTEHQLPAWFLVLLSPHQSTAKSEAT